MQFFSRALVVSLLAAGITGVGGAANSAPTDTCTVAPDAAATHTDLGRTIAVLHPHDGRIYYGYGDYSENSGSYGAELGLDPPGTNVSYLDPKTNKTHVAFKAFRTEAVLTYRTFDGDLYVPNIDPSAGAKADNSYVTNKGGSWRDVASAGAEAAHIYDVAKVGSSVFVAGSNRAAADDKAQYRGVIFRSNDSGASFRESLTETPKVVSERTGFERFYWVGAIGKKVYARAAVAGAPAIRVLDTTQPGNTWLKAPAAGAHGPFFGSQVTTGREVTAWRGVLIDEKSPIGPVWYDGYRVEQVASLPSGSKVSTGPGNKLYAMAPDGAVLRVTGGKEIKVPAKSVRSALSRTLSVFGVPWKRVSKRLKKSGVLRLGNTISFRTPFETREIARVDSGSTAFAVADGKAFFAPPGGTSQICSTPIPAKK